MRQLIAPGASKVGSVRIRKPSISISAVGPPISVIRSGFMWTSLLYGAERRGTRHQINAERHWNDPHQIPDFDVLAKNNPGEQHANGGIKK